MISEPFYTINQIKYEANRHLETKEGYQWYSVNKHGLTPFANSKLYFKEKLIAQTISDMVKGRSVLDLGCDKGYFSWWSMKCGATSVTANDINMRLYKYLHLLFRTMRWNIEILVDDLFQQDSSRKWDCVLALALLHQLPFELDASIRIIRSICSYRCIIEFCEDYQKSLGDNWNVSNFEQIINRFFTYSDLIASYPAIGKYDGVRYIYDCRCN